MERLRQALGCFYKLGNVESSRDRFVGMGFQEFFDLSRMLMWLVTSSSLLVAFPLDIVATSYFEL